MKKLLINNFGLKIISVLIAIVLWIVIVNIDDPVISRTYSGIQVEMTNEKAINDQGKTYEIMDNSDVVSVTVSAKRSIIESLSKDNIKATADLKQLTFMNTVPIEFKTSRYSDQIQSINSRTTNVQVQIENRIQKKVKVTFETEGNVADGYVVGDITPNVSVITVTGPESVVERVSAAKIVVDLESMNESFTYSALVELITADGTVIDDAMITASAKEIRTRVEVLETKEIPINAGYVGTPANGFTATGTVICEPSSIVVAGLGPVFSNLSSITIKDEDLVIDGATGNYAEKIDITKYLPTTVRLADDNDKLVEVTAVIEPNEIVKVPVNVSDIIVLNVPDGVKAEIIHNGIMQVEVSVSGLSDKLGQLNGYTAIGAMDANAFTPVYGPDEDEGDEVPHIGINEGPVVLKLPDGINQVETLTLQVLLSRGEEEEITE